MRHLDTNIVIAHLNGNVEVTNKIKYYLPEVAISSLVLGELLFGARASERANRNVEKVIQFLQVVNLVNFDQSSADVYSHIRLSLRKKGRPTGEVDLLIASIALANNAILVTHNIRHFENIDNLILEDWLE